MHTRHFSYYVNVPQTLGVITAGVCAWRWIKMEEAKAGIEDRPVIDLIKEDGSKIAKVVSKKFLGGKTGVQVLKDVFHVR